MYGCNTCAFMKKTRIEVGVHVVHEHFPPEKVPFLCTLCGAHKLSAKTAKEHRREKHPSSKLNLTMMFTGTKQRVEFTSKHVQEVPSRTQNQCCWSVWASIWTATENKAFPQNQKSPIEQQVGRVLDFNVVSPPTSPNTEMSLPPTSRDPFKQGTTPG